MLQHPEHQYLSLVREILDKGLVQTDKGTGVKTFSVFGRQIRFDLSKGFPLLTTKKVYWKGVLHELYWFLSGQSNIQYLVKNNVHIWDDYPYKLYNEKVAKGGVSALTKDEFLTRIASDDAFAREHGELTHIYGHLWRRWPAKEGRAIDQVKWALNEVMEDPDCHNAIVTSWNPEYLYRMAKPEEACRFPICHNMYQLNVKDDKLCLQLYQRSADIFLGVPFNIASYALLTHILAHLAGYRAGEFVHTFGDVHIYENHIEQAKEQLAREPRPFPTVRIDSGATTLENFRSEHVVLEGYDPHPPIKAELTVAGGYVEKKK
ncbi:MAG: thymidylate synthase [Parcubacteria group bacterium Greene0416_79]|nr:MAG: thymidylate synthase [Parcubacteria group bacterium Greene0416_79]